MNFPAASRLIVLFALLLTAWSVPAQQLDLAPFAGLKPRSIGPANMSGRISAIEAVISNPAIIYTGTATGGVWKSEDGGVSWKPVFDEQPVASIGALAIFQKNPSIVWVATGEGSVRNSVGVGRGVYRSLDAGRSWTCLGLEKTEHISRLLLHPDNPDIAWVAALGTTWGENPERGVFKTTDGGQTWQKILYVDEKTGIADLAMDPADPNKLIAASWEHRRWPWFFNSGGPGSGLYLTSDGGKNWKKLTPKEGLPKGDLGRMGIAFAASRPEVVYALVEAEKNCLLRSTDGGYNWRTVNSESGINDRPFYYCDIRVNPVNENIIYLLASSVRVSEDGGKTLRSLANFSQSHSDYHAMWLHPDGETLMLGNDGGIVISADRGQHWRFVQNLPAAQFYHVSFDMDLPYHVYGGLQDNGTWRGPGWLLNDRSINDYHWIMTGFGDGFDSLPDPDDSSCGYGMSQGGALFYFDVQSGRSRDIRPAESDVKHRYNWNAGLAQDPFEKATIYYGSQFVHQSTDKGRSWQIISPDLTTNDPEKQKQAESGGLTLDVTAAENYCTILSIAPSPLKSGVIWVGTDDGNVQLTTDGGKSWRLVSKEITGSGKGKVPAGTCVPHIEASSHDPGAAYVVFENHQRADWTPYVFRVTGSGEKWESLATPELDGFCWVVEEDRINPDLLFLGTEFGLYVSIDGGRHWSRWTHGFPTVAVRDLAIQPRENDLIIATHGRGLYILDDISFLREAKPEILRKKLHLFPTATAVQYRTGSATPWMSPGDTVFRGQNRPTGAWLTFHHLPDRPEAAQAPGGEARPPENNAGGPPAGREGRRRSGAAGEDNARPGEAGGKLKIEILDRDGKVIRELDPATSGYRPAGGFMDFMMEPAPDTPGTDTASVQRIFWDLREKGLERPARPGQARGSGGRSGRTPSGLMVLPGSYTIRMTAGAETVTRIIEVKADPRFDPGPAVLAENYRLAKEFQGWLEKFYQAQKSVESAQQTLNVLKEQAAGLPDPAKKDLLEMMKSQEEKLRQLAGEVNPEPKKQGIADSSQSLSRKVFAAAGALNDLDLPAGQAALVLREKAKTALDAYLNKVNTFFSADWPALEAKVKELALSPFKPYTPVTLEKQP